MERDLPSGTVTFLFTDVEGSTRLLDALGSQGDYFGRTFNIAARIPARAPPDCVYAGESVVGVVRQDGGERRIGGIA